MAAEDLRTDLERVCRRIADGSVDPVAGARRIWVLMAEADYPPEIEEFRVFVGLVSEIDDHPERAAVYTRDIADEARRVIAAS